MNHYIERWRAGDQNVHAAFMAFAMFADAAAAKKGEEEADTAWMPPALQVLCQQLVVGPRLTPFEDDEGEDDNPRSAKRQRVADVSDSDADDEDDDALDAMDIDNRELVLNAPPPPPPLEDHLSTLIPEMIKEIFNALLEDAETSEGRFTLYYILGQISRTLRRQRPAFTYVVDVDSIHFRARNLRASHALLVGMVEVGALMLVNEVSLYRIMTASPRDMEQLGYAFGLQRLDSVDAFLQSLGNPALMGVAALRNGYILGQLRQGGAVVWNAMSENEKEVQFSWAFSSADPKIDNLPERLRSQVYVKLGDPPLPLLVKIICDFYFDDQSDLAGAIIQFINDSLDKDDVDLTLSIHDQVHCETLTNMLLLLDPLMPTEGYPARGAGTTDLFVYAAQRRSAAYVINRLFMCDAPDHEATGLFIREAIREITATMSHGRIIADIFDFLDVRDGLVFNIASELTHNKNIHLTGDEFEAIVRAILNRVPNDEDVLRDLWFHYWHPGRLRVLLKVLPEGPDNVHFDDETKTRVTKRFFKYIIDPMRSMGLRGRHRLFRLWIPLWRRIHSSIGKFAETNKDGTRRLSFGDYASCVFRFPGTLGSINDEDYVADLSNFPAVTQEDLDYK
jgi:hypothetical protein